MLLKVFFEDFDFYNQNTTKKYMIGAFEKRINPSEAELGNIILQLNSLAGDLVWLHEKNIIYGDIKPGRI